MPSDVRRKFEVAFGSLGAKDLDAEIQSADKSLADLEARGKSVAKALQQASASTEQSENQIVAAARKNAERRVRLLEDESKKRIRLLELRQQRELDSARRRNENLADLEALHAKQRQDLEEKIAESAERQAERQAKAEERAARRARKRELANAEARARAIEDAGDRELALLDVRHQKEIERARGQGRDLAALQAAQARERADAVERIESQSGVVEGALERTAAGTEEVGRNAGEAFESVNQGLKSTLDPFGDVIERVGGLEDVFRVFSGFVVVEAVEAVTQFVTTMYEMTEAGKAAKRQTEAQAAANEELKSSFDRLITAGELNLDFMLRMRNASAGLTLAEEEYNEALQKRAELNAPLAEAMRELAIFEERAGDQANKNSQEYGRLRENVDRYQRLVDKTNKTLQEHRERLLANNRARKEVEAELERAETRWERLTDKIAAGTRSLAAHIETQAAYRIALAEGHQPARDTLDLLAGFAARGVQAYEAVTEKAKAYTKAAGQAREATQALSAWLAQNIDNADDGLFDRLAALDDTGVELPWVQALLDLQVSDLGDKLNQLGDIAAGFGAARDRDALRQTELDGGDVQLAARLQALRAGYEAELQLAAEHGDNVALITELYQRRVTQAIEEGTERRLAAQAAEVEASAGQVVQLGQAAHSLAKNVGASKGVLAGIERVMELAMAAKEIAAGVGSAATGDVIGAGVHFAAASAHVTAAAKFGEVPGSSGKGGSAPAPPQYSRVISSSPTAADLPRNRGGGGPGSNSTVIHIYGASDPRGARDAISTHYDQRGYGEVRFEQGAA